MYNFLRDCCEECACYVCLFVGVCVCTHVRGIVTNTPVRGNCVLAQV